jgi:hypothetical protein
MLINPELIPTFSGSTLYDLFIHQGDHAEPHANQARTCARCFCFGSGFSGGRSKNEKASIPRFSG